MPEPMNIFAVYSPNALTIHLHDPGFRTTKPRNYPVALCGAPAHLEWGRDKTPTGRVHIPIADAARLEREPLPPNTDARIAPTLRPRRWCGKCLGIALANTGHADAALNLLLDDDPEATLNQIDDLEHRLHMVLALADSGTGHDLNPTSYGPDGPPRTGGYVGYIKELDDTWRSRIRAAARGEDPTTFTEAQLAQLRSKFGLDSHPTTQKG